MMMTKNPTIKNRDRDKSSYEIIKNIIATIKKHEMSRKNCAFVVKKKF